MDNVRAGLGNTFAQLQWFEGRSGRLKTKRSLARTAEVIFSLCSCVIHDMDNEFLQNDLNPRGESLNFLSDLSMILW